MGKIKPPNERTQIHPDLPYAEYREFRKWSAKRLKVYLAGTVAKPGTRHNRAARRRAIALKSAGA